MSTVIRVREKLKQLQTLEQQSAAQPVAVDALALFRNAWGEPDLWQQQALTSDWQRLLLNCSRQAGKSTVSSTIAVDVALTIPNALVLLVSPSLRQSGELFQKCQHVYNSTPGLQALKYETKLSLEVDNGSRIISLPGKPETIRGFSAVTLLLVDEGSFVADRLFAAVRPMLAVSRGRMAVLSSPFGTRGEFHRMCTIAKDAIAQRQHTSYTYIEVPATEVPRISPEFLEDERIALGPLFEQEYMCQFLNSEQSLFSFEEVQQALDAGQEIERWF